jgi:hypothetical protein
MAYRALITVLLSLFAGCSGGDDVDNAAWRGSPEVTGTVTLDGSPLSGAEVSFDPAAGDSLFAIADDDGRFSMELTESAIGKYAVRIRMPNATTVAETGENQFVPAKYNKNTQLVVDVFDGKNTFTFELESGDVEVE